MNTPGYMGGLGTLAEVGHLHAIPAHYGASDAEASEGLPPELTQTIEILAGSVWAQANTPEELRARIANLQQLQRQFPAAGALTANRIRRLEGRLAAKERELAQAGQWRNLGRVGGSVGILVGFGLLGLIIVTIQRGGRGG